MHSAWGACLAAAAAAEGQPAEPGGFRGLGYDFGEHVSLADTRGG